MKTKKVLLSFCLTVFFLSCQPASVSYIDPSKNPNSIQSAAEQSCTILRVSNSQVRVQCPDGTSETINDGVAGLNGLNGTNGSNGSDGKSVEIIDPCGPESAIGFDEILIRLPDRTLIVYFKFANFEHLTKLVPGHTYVTTDDTSCEFKIDEEGTVYDSKGSMF